MKKKNHQCQFSNSSDSICSDFDRRSFTRNVRSEAFPRRGLADIPFMLRGNIQCVVCHHLRDGYYQVCCFPSVSFPEQE